MKAILEPRLALNHIRVDTGNGFGSTDTMVRRFTNKTVDEGGMITHATSAANGDTFTIETPGYYLMNYVEYKTTAGGYNMGISRNSSQLTTSITLITQTDQVVIQTILGFVYSQCTAFDYLLPGDVIRPHSDGAPQGAAGLESFDIKQMQQPIGALQNLFPYERVRVRTGASGTGHGSTDTMIREFVNKDIDVGDAITHSSTTTNGDTFTIEKPGIYGINYYDYKVSAGGIFTVGISLNSTLLTMAYFGNGFAARRFGRHELAQLVAGVCGAARFNVGDVLRPHTDGNQDSTAGLEVFDIMRLAA